MAGGTRPCVPPCYGSGSKAEFGYDDRKGVGACGRGPSGWEKTTKSRLGREN